MKKLFYYLTILILTNSLAINFVNAQTNNQECKVLKTEISGYYEGECKKGLAHGLGKARGTDYYEGEFKRGLPHGNGKYIWANGDTFEGEWLIGVKNGNGRLVLKNQKDSVIEGRWYKDNLVSRIENNSFSDKIMVQKNVKKVQITKLASSGNNKIEIKVQRESNNYDLIDLDNIRLQGSSGYTLITINFIGFEFMSFPFQGNIVFDTTNTVNGTILDCIVRFMINEPGTWLIEITY